MHRDDLSKLAPQWLNYTRIMRNDMEVKGVGDSSDGNSTSFKVVPDAATSLVVGRVAVSARCHLLLQSCCRT